MHPAKFDINDINNVNLHQHFHPAKFDINDNNAKLYKHFHPVKTDTNIINDAPENHNLTAIIILFLFFNAYLKHTKR